MPQKTHRIALSAALERRELVQPGPEITHVNVRRVQDADGKEVTAGDMSLQFGTSEPAPIYVGDEINACDERKGLWLTAAAVDGAVLVLVVNTEA